jgi:hypothetical protein
MRHLALILSAFLILAFRLSASACVAGATLASYEALGVGGCTIGPQTVDDFTFSVVSSGGGAIPLADTDITVTPTFGPDFYGVQFASTGFLVTGAGFVNYLIGYTWDSIPIRGMGDVLDPGTVDILTNGCVGAAFAGASCGGTPVSVDVNLGQLTDFVAFSPTTILGVRNNISLNANGTSASFDSIENDAYVTPEPASFLLAGLGMAMLAAGVRRRRRFSATND